MKKTFLLTLLIGLMCFGLNAYGVAPAEAAETGSDGINDKKDINRLLKSLNIRQTDEPVKAPDFELMSLNGKRLSLNGYRDKVVLLSFWATW